MTVDQAVRATYLIVSVLMVALHTRAVVRLRRAKAQKFLTRTTGCRVLCSLLYIAVGVNAVTRNWAAQLFPLAVYCVTQLIWGANTVLDERLGVPKRRRRRWPITITIGREPEPSSVPNRTETP